MSTALLSLENTQLNNNGTNYILPITAPMMLNGITVSVSFASSPNFAPQIAGIVEVLTLGYLLPSAPQFGAAPLFGIGAQTPVEFGAPALAGVTDNAAIGPLSKDVLFAWILKAYMPLGVNKDRYFPLNLAAVPGDYIAIHAEHGLFGPIDFEMQAVLNYTPS